MLQRLFDKRRKTPRKRTAAYRRPTIERLEDRQFLNADYGFVRDNTWHVDTDGDHQADVAFQYGEPGDQFVVGQWGKAKAGDRPSLVQPGPGRWLRWSADFDYDPQSEVSVLFGQRGEVAVVGDWDGDGVDNIGTVRSLNSGRLQWRLDTDLDRGVEIKRKFGRVGDIPVVGNFDGKPGDEIAVVRSHENGNLVWLINTDRDFKPEDSFVFGKSRSDTPIVGDWNGDGTDDGGVIRPTEDNTALRWLLDTNRDAARDIKFNLGKPGDTPIVANFHFPEISLQTDVDGSAAEITSGQSEAISLGELPAGGTKLQQKFTIRNLGDYRLDLGDITFASQAGDDEDASFFRVLAAPPERIGGGKSATMTIELDTTNDSRGDDRYRAVVSIATSDLDENPFQFTIAATREVEAGQPDITILVPGEDGAVDFGAVRFGSAAPKRHVRIRNDGTADLAIDRISLNSTAPFQIVNSSPTRLKPGETATVEIAMRTSSAGSFQAMLAILSDDPDEPRNEVRLSGRIVLETGPTPPPNSPTPPSRSPEIDVSGIRDGQTTPVSFGDVRPGSTPPARSFVIRNTGNKALDVSRISISNSNFSPVGFRSQQIAPGGQFSFEIQMNTTRTGQHLAEVKIFNSDSNENPYNFRLSGRVVAAPKHPDIDVVGIVDGQKSPVSIGRTEFGSSGVTRTFAVRNTGNTSLRISRLYIAQSHSLPHAFSAVNFKATTLAPGGQMTFAIKLNASRSGVNEARVSITSNDPDERSFDFPIVGEVTARPATPPEVSVRFEGRELQPGQTGRIDYGCQYQQTLPYRTINVRNTGERNLTLGNLRVPNGFRALDRLPSQLGPGRSTDLRVAVNVGSRGTKQGTVSFTTNDPDERVVNIAVHAHVIGTRPDYDPRLHAVNVPHGVYRIHDIGATKIAIEKPSGRVPYDAKVTVRTYRPTGVTAVSLNSSVYRIEAYVRPGVPIINCTHVHVVRKDTRSVNAVPLPTATRSAQDAPVFPVESTSPHVLATLDSSVRASLSLPATTARQVPAAEPVDLPRTIPAQRSDHGSIVDEVFAELASPEEALSST